MRGKMAVLMVAFAMLMASFALGAVENATTSVGESGSYDETSSSGSYNAVQGNVTEINLVSDTSTDRWQGFYGNTTATLALGLGTQTMYDFGEQPVTAVYASTDAGFDFTNIQAIDASQADSASVWDFSSGVDQVQDVYNTSGTYDSISGVNSTTVDTNFNAYITADTSSPGAKADFAFGGEVLSSAAAGINGNNQYELMVPTDGSNEPYYFFMSI